MEAVKDSASPGSQKDNDVVKQQQQLHNEAVATSPDKTAQDKNHDDDDDDDDKNNNNGLKNGNQSSSSFTSSSLVSAVDTKHQYTANLKQVGRSMKDRGAIPASFYVSLSSILVLYYATGFGNPTLSTLLPPQHWSSIQSSYQDATRYMQEQGHYLQFLIHNLWFPQQQQQQQQQQEVVVGTRAVASWKDYVVAAVSTLFVAWVMYILFLAPLLVGGFWTGRRAHKHIVHRYMGLLYLVQYPLAWSEFAARSGDNSHSFLPHLVALNGIIQAWSAFFSFKVLPELNDAGYYGDKSVLSRSFVHENAFFQLMCLFGSLYYHDECRARLRRSTLGQCLESIFMFWPYIVLRPLFPTTRFKDAGQTHKGRSVSLQKFYEYGTTAIKIFFLYAKYFLGFYFNFLIFLDLPTAQDWKLLRGCLLLNIGTVSIAIFLHTLRFKKVFPGVLTFSIYLAQIYATILGIPFAWHIFTSHPKLLSLCFLGLLCNMTRSRVMHAAWCLVASVLLSYYKNCIQW